MKKCLICYKEIEDNEEFCGGCIKFFKWKYQSKFRKVDRDKPSIDFVDFDSKKGQELLAEYEEGQ